MGVVLVAGVLLLAGCGTGTQRSGVQVGPGVTDQPCPHAVNKRHGCIYLGLLPDLSGPFRSIGVPVTKAQAAFWRRVDQQGGIGDYDVDATTYVRDNHYDPAIEKQAYQEIKDKVLALAQTLGSPTTSAILDDLRASKMLAVPLSFSSAWLFQDVMLEVGASYCFQSMNAVDYAVQTFKAKNVMTVHYPGDYGDDADAGAAVAARTRGIHYVSVPTGQGPDNQGAAVEAIVKGKPDMVVLATGPADAEALVSRAVARGFQGRFAAVNPVWIKSLLKGPAAEALRSRFLQIYTWKPYAADSPGHTAMREALRGADPDDSYISGWVPSYALKAVLEKAVQNRDLTREGVYKAAKQITSVDFEGMLPAKAGNRVGDVNTTAFRETVLLKPDDREFTGVRVLSDFSAGPSATSYDFKAPCFKSHERQGCAVGAGLSARLHLVSSDCGPTRFRSGAELLLNGGCGRIRPSPMGLITSGARLPALRRAGPQCVAICSLQLQWACLVKRVAARAVAGTRCGVMARGQIVTIRAEHSRGENAGEHLGDDLEDHA
jgi:ABC-type branched-subunit amino acid transport system substrate-binding protein